MELSRPNLTTLKIFTKMILFHIKINTEAKLSKLVSFVFVLYVCLINLKMTDEKQFSTRIWNRSTFFKISKTKERWCKTFKEVICTIYLYNNNIYKSKGTFLKASSWSMTKKLSFKVPCSAKNLHWMRMYL